jgi:hypothetical protein
VVSSYANTTQRPTLNKSVNKCIFKSYDCKASCIQN